MAGEIEAISLTQKLGVGAVSGPILSATKHLGADEVLPKPIPTDKLIGLLKTLIG